MSRRARHVDHICHTHLVTELQGQGGHLTAMVGAMVEKMRQHQPQWQADRLFPEK